MSRALEQKSRALEQKQPFLRNDIVIVAPADTDDPMAAEWQGRKCRVEIHASSEIYEYVRVRDLATEHKATFRPKDLRRV